MTVEPWIDDLWPALHKELDSSSEQNVVCAECESVSRVKSGLLMNEMEKIGFPEGVTLKFSPVLASTALNLPPKSAEFLQLEFVEPSGKVIDPS